MIVCHHNFRRALIEAVDSGLQSFGESPRSAIYFHLERNLKLRREEIPEKVKSFHEGLENIFGSGSRAVETIIVRDLYTKLGLEFEERIDFKFQDYVRQALKQFEKEDVPRRKRGKKKPSLRA
ncbi:MAG: hypothetical protein PVF15_03420 [Candidatus Bathyarchaeota archaeon]|jgi:hypothetical protein